jgi:hypothetical protein
MSANFRDGVVAVALARLKEMAPIYSHLVDRQRAIATLESLILLYCGAPHGCDGALGNASR